MDIFFFLVSADSLFNKHNTVSLSTDILTRHLESVDILRMRVLSLSRFFSSSLT